jgi:hypothetical protein
MKRLIPNRPQARAAVAVAATALVAGLVPLTGAVPTASAASSCGAWTTVDHDSVPDHGYDVDLYLKTRKCTIDGQTSRRFTSVVCNRKVTGKDHWMIKLVRNGTIVWQAYDFWFPPVGDCRALNSEGEWAGSRDEVGASLFIGWDGEVDEGDTLFVDYTMPA